MFRLVHATPIHPSLCLPHSNPTITVTITIDPVLLLLLLCCYYYKLLLPINFYEQELFPGAAELTTQLLRLASILWLPLCRINKLGNTTLEDCCDPLYLWVISGHPGPPLAPPLRLYLAPETLKFGERPQKYFAASAGRKLQ